MFLNKKSAELFKSKNTSFLMHLFFMYVMQRNRNFRNDVQLIKFGNSYPLFNVDKPKVNFVLMIILVRFIKKISSDHYSNSDWLVVA